LTFWFKEPGENPMHKKPQTPSPTTPSPKGDNLCKICGKKTQEHDALELKLCITKVINNSMVNKDK